MMTKTVAIFKYFKLKKEEFIQNKTKHPVINKTANKSMNDYHHEH